MNKKIHNNVTYEQITREETKSVTPCMYETREKVPFGDIFFKKGWQNQLCRCVQCMKMYAELQVLWMFQLTSDDETTHTLTEDGEQCEDKAKNGGTQAENNVSSLSVDLLTSGFEAFKRKFDHIQQIEFIRSFNEFTSSLKEFLRPFAEQNKIVSSEDIMAFYEEMRRKKRQKFNHNFQL
jgi:E3 ubiquitin-protein ligase UBR7